MKPKTSLAKQFKLKRERIFTASSLNCSDKEKESQSLSQTVKAKAWNIFHDIITNCPKKELDCSDYTMQSFIRSMTTVQDNEPGKFKLKISSDQKGDLSNQLREEAKKLTWFLSLHTLQCTNYNVVIKVQKGRERKYHFEQKVKGSRYKIFNAQEKSCWSNG